MKLFVEQEQRGAHPKREFKNRTAVAPKKTGQKGDREHDPHQGKNGYVGGNILP